MSTGLGFALLALGLLAGFVLGWIAFQSPWSGRTGTAALFDEELVKTLYEDASPAVVEISVSRPGRFSGIFSRVDSGSGFLVDGEGHIVTNFHVVEGSNDIEVLLFDGRVLPATKLGTSPLDDLALLQVDPAAVSGIDPLPLADSDDITPGQMAIAIGSPFRERNSVTVGVVSGTDRTRQGEFMRPIPGLVQTDAALNPGNSGGPLLNSLGEVMGVNTSVEVVSSVQIGVGYAVPSNTLSQLLPQLKRPGEVRRPWIGITSRRLTRADVAALGLPTDSDLYIGYVCRGSPAQRAGLRGDPMVRPTGLGDLIVAIDGIPVLDMADMVTYLNALAPDDMVRLTVFRGGDTRQVDVVLAGWPEGRPPGSLWRPVPGELCPS